MKCITIAVPLLLMLMLSSVAIADTVYIDGKPCFVMGNTVNCGGTLSNPGQDEAARAARAETNRLKAKARQLDECLRKSDWPGSPSRSECQSMYGE